MDSRYNPILKVPFHEGAGIMALIAIYATKKDKFWPVNDYLFSIAGDDLRIDIDHLAALFGLNSAHMKTGLKDFGIRRMLLRDIQQGVKLGLTGTPSYVIGDQVYHGMLPPAVFNQIQNSDS
jgi:protein-disulfide isomerase